VAAGEGVGAEVYVVIGGGISRVCIDQVRMGERWDPMYISRFPQSR
jgi:hypothetical protein